MIKNLKIKITLTPKSILIFLNFQILDFIFFQHIYLYLYHRFFLSHFKELVGLVLLVF